jgi:hypothetical protein
MKVFVTGGTGLLGRALVARLLERGDEVDVLTRSSEKARRRLPAGVRLHKGDPRTDGPWQEVVADVDAVVNLAGANIAEGRWTEGRKRELRHSRLATTANLVSGIERSPRCRVLVSASAIGYYGDRGSEALTEAHEPGSGFLARLTHEWESAALQAESARCRVVCARFAVVLARGGGALAKMLPFFKLGLGARLGNGRQYFPWIHRADVAKALLFALDNDELRGPVNVVAPDPPTQAAFARDLATRLGRPCILRIPAVLLKAILGEMAETLLASARVVPNALRARGFGFEHADLEAALRDLLD